MTKDPQIEKILRLAEECAKEENYIKAQEILRGAAKKWPNEGRVWSTFAYVAARSKNYKEAVEMMETAIATSDSNPHYRYMCGQYLFKLKDFAAAEEMFTKALDISDALGDTYYVSPSYFFRAECRIRLRKYEEASSDCNFIPDSMKTWAGGIRVKSDLLSDIAAGLAAEG